MRSPVISGQYLVENPEARHQHEAGLGAALGATPNFSEAIDHFDEADAILRDSFPTIDRNVQLARVQRDKGFTMVRRAVSLGDPDRLDTADMVLKGSARLTASAAGQSGELSYDTDSDLPITYGTRKRARREIFAEHGATLSLLGRLITAKEVLLGTETSGDSEEATKARLDDQAYYGAAHDFLRIGGNGYYLVSNAMCGARQEVLNGQRRGSSVWLARAARGLVWIAVHDRRNLSQARDTAGSRALHLASQGAARQSVLVKP